MNALAPPLETRPGVAVFVLCGRPCRLAPETLTASLQERLGDRVEVGRAGSTDTLVIAVGEARYIAFGVDHPVPASEWEGSLPVHGDPDGPQAMLGRHKAHVVLSTLSAPASMDGAIAQAVDLLALACALPPACEPLGVFWLPSRRLVPLDLAAAIADGARRGLASLADAGSDRAARLPVSFWVRIQLAGGDGLVAGRTQGLAGFVGYELDLPPARREPQAAHDLLASLVGYLFDRGPVFEHGQHIDVGNGEVMGLAAVPAAEGAPGLMVLRAGGRGH